MEALQQKAKVILVEPSGPLNVGSVARLCKNFGVKELRLVAPRCDPNDAEAQRMAVKGKSFLANAQIYSNLLDAISDCGRIVATAGRIDHGDIPLYSPEEVMNWSLKGPIESSIALVFGREDRGLTNQELLLANKVISLNHSSSYPSLNLSHAVAIVLHELYRSEAKSSLNRENKVEPIASPRDVNNFVKDAEALLLEIGFLYDHTAKSRMSKIKSVLQRAEIRAEEVALIRGIVRQMRWAIENQNS